MTTQRETALHLLMRHSDDPGFHWSFLSGNSNRKKHFGAGALGPDCGDCLIACQVTVSAISSVITSLLGSSHRKWNKCVSLLMVIFLKELPWELVRTDCLFPSGTHGFQWHLQQHKMDLKDVSLLQKQEKCKTPQNVFFLKSQAYLHASHELACKNTQVFLHMHSHKKENGRWSKCCVKWLHLEVGLPPKSWTLIFFQIHWHSDQAGRLWR